MFFHHYFHPLEGWLYKQSLPTLRCFFLLFFCDVGFLFKVNRLFKEKYSFTSSSKSPDFEVLFSSVFLFFCDVGFLFKGNHLFKEKYSFTSSAKSPDFEVFFSSVFLFFCDVVSLFKVNRLFKEKCSFTSSAKSPDFEVLFFCFFVMLVFCSKSIAFLKRTVLSLLFPSDSSLKHLLDVLCGCIVIHPYRRGYYVDVDCLTSSRKNDITKKQHHTITTSQKII